MQDNKPRWWPFIVPIVFFLIIITGGRIIFGLLVIYIIYKIISNIINKQSFSLEDYIQNKINDIGSKKTINLKSDQKGSFSFSKSFTPPKMPTIKFKYVVMTVIALLLLFIVLDGLVSVPPGNVAVIYDRGRGILKNELTEGLHLKIPFWQKSQLFTTKKQIFTMAGEYMGVADEDAVRARSKDGQNVTVDVSITYRIDGKDTPTIYGRFITEDGYKTTIVNPAGRSIVYDAASKFDALDLVSAERDNFSKLIHNNLAKIYADNEIELNEIFVRNVTFSDEFAKEIEDKQIQVQRKQTEMNRKEAAREIAERVAIEAKGEADAIRELAKGEADAITLKGEALKLNPAVIQLEFVNKMAPEINWGILPEGALPLIDLKNL